jgi:hypothetical protein
MASETPIVAIVKYGPRSRNAGRPIRTENAAPSTAAGRRVAHGLQPFRVRSAVVYAPIPRNAE